MINSSDSDSTSNTEFPVAAGCSIGCALWFLLFAVLWPLGYILTRTFEGGEQSFFALFVGGPGFLFGNILALFGYFSPSKDSRRLALIALAIMWIPILAAVVLFAIGSLLQ